MANKDYNKMTESILELVGGKENVVNLYNCFTRLRFTLINKEAADLEEIKKVDGVLGAQWSGEQLQVIIGQDVSSACKILKDKIGNMEEIQVEEEPENKKITPKSVINSLCDVISGCVLPIIPILVASGMTNVLLLVLTMTNVLAEESSTYLILKVVADAGFYFFPVFIGAFAAKKFKTSESLGMLMGAILIAPDFVEAISAGTSLTFLKIPVLGVTYSSTVIPIILIVYVMSHVERIIKKYCPEILASIFVPLLTVLIMIPLALCVLGPLASYIGDYMAIALMWLYNTTGFIGVAVIAALFPFLIITGMHNSMLPFVLQTLATNGYEPFMSPVLFVHNFTQGAASFAVALLTKNKKVKSLALGCGVQAVFATISEPALYGITLKYKKPLYAAMAGDFVGGLILGIFQVHLYTFGGTGIFSFLNFVGPNPYSIVGMIIAVIVSMIITFVLTLILMKNQSIE